MYARAVIVVGLLALLGCGGGGGHHHAASSASAAASAAAPSKTVEAPLSAADGSRLSSCRKGRCEVLVSAGDAIHPPAKVGVPNVTVKSVSAKGVTFVGTGAGIVLTFSGQQPGMTSYMNKLAITTVAIRDGRAVVRFAPK